MMIELTPARQAKLRELFEAFMERHGIKDEQEAVEQDEEHHEAGCVEQVQPQRH